MSVPMGDDELAALKSNHAEMDLVFDRIDKIVDGGKRACIDGPDYKEFMLLNARYEQLIQEQKRILGGGITSINYQ